MLQNNLDPEVAERPDDLVVYGGTGRAARSWEAFDAMLRTLRTLADDETMLVQSGKPVGVLRTHEWAPRVLHRQLQPRARLGQLERVPPSRGGRPDDVRPDDRRVVDLHRDPGDPAGHVRVLRRDRPPPLRRLTRRHDHADRRPRRDGRSAAAGGHDERRRRAVHRRRSAPRPAAHRDPLPRRGGRPTSTTPSPAARAARRRVAPRRSGSSAMPPRSCRACSTSTSRPTSSPTRRAPTTRCPTCPSTSRRTPPRSSPAPIPTATCAGPGNRSPCTARRWSGSSTRAPRSSTTATACAPRPSSAGSTGRSPTPASSRLHPAVVLRGQGTVPVGGPLRRPGRHRSHRSGGARGVPRRRRPGPLDPPRRRAGRLPGPAGTHLLARLRRTPPPRVAVQRDGPPRRAVGADRHRSRPPRLGLGRLAVPRDRGDGRRIRRHRRLAAAQRPREHVVGRDVGVDPPRRRRRHRPLDPRRDGRRRRRLGPRRGQAGAGADQRPWDRRDPPRRRRLRTGQRRRRRARRAPADDRD